MRQWRVGSFSTGGALILLGVAFLWSIWMGREALDIVMKGWPIICILLGVEVLVQLFLSRKENQVLRYDLFSMFLTGAITVFCLGLALISATGLMGELRYQVGAVERTIELEDMALTVPETVNRIIVQTPYGTRPAIDRIEGDQLLIFGTYRTTSLPGEFLHGDSKPATIRTVGETIYISLLEPPARRGMSHSRTEGPHISITLPDDVTVQFGLTEYP